MEDQTEAGVRRTASRGMVLMVGQTIVSKGFATLAQLALARWLLSPAEFGVIAIAYAIRGAAGLIEQTGVRDILIREEPSESTQKAAFGVSALLAAVVALILTVAAQPAANHYDSPALADALRLFALASIIAVPSVLPLSKLQRSLNFSAVAVTNLLEAAVQAATTLLSAALGAGAASVAWGAVAGVAGRGLVASLQASEIGVVRPNLAAWKAIVLPGSQMFVIGALTVAAAQGDYFLLSLYHTKQTVGYYYFAFNLSGQVVVLLAAASGAVLMPAYSRLRADRGAQTEAFTTNVRVLALVGIPVAFTQAVLARPLLVSVFGEQWEPAAGLLAALSTGVAVRIASGPSHSLLRAQGRLRTYLIFYAATAVSFIALVWPAARYGTTYLVAWIVAIHITLSELMLLRLSLPAELRRPATFKEIFSVPLQVAAVTAGAAWVTSTVVANAGASPLNQLLVGSVMAVLSYAATLQWRAPIAADVLRRQLRSIFSRLR